MRLLFWAVLAGFFTGPTVYAADSAPALHWYRGNTHAHSVNSDGDSSPDVVARWYKEHDYQFLFITDHEYITDVAALNAIFGAKDRFLLLPGQEITQWGADPKRSAAHLNALFAKIVVWPQGEQKCMGAGCGATASATVPIGQTIDANIAAIKAEGALVQVNHPNYRWSVKPSDLDNVPDGTLLEIWNGQGGINNLGGDDGTGDVHPSAEGYWDILLSKGKVVWGVGSDDSHSFTEPEVYNVKSAAPGQAWIVVRAPELTATAVRRAIEQGAFYASNGVALDDISVSKENLTLTIHQKSANGARFVTRFVGQNGQTLAIVYGPNPAYRFTGRESYVRAAVMDSNGQRAWTQPVFLDGRRNGS